jgi:hypothetical protein
MIFHFLAVHNFSTIFVTYIKKRLPPSVVKMLYKNDQADKSRPVKMTRRTKALLWKWQGGQKPSHENDRAAKSPPVKNDWVDKMTMISGQLLTCVIIIFHFDFIYQF